MVKQARAGEGRIHFRERAIQHYLSKYRVRALPIPRGYRYLVLLWFLSIAALLVGLLMWNSRSTRVLYEGTVSAIRCASGERHAVCFEIPVTLTPGNVDFLSNCFGNGVSL